MKVLILGSNPASGKGSPHRNTTLNRVSRWAETVGFQYDFKNVIPYHVEKEDIKLADEKRIRRITRSYKRIISLGSFSSRVLKRLNISHYSLPHPSTRNRLFNEKGYEDRMLEQLKSSRYTSL